MKLVANQESCTNLSFDLQSAVNFAIYHIHSHPAGLVSSVFCHVQEEMAFICGYISLVAVRLETEAIGFIISPQNLKTDCARWEINPSLFQSAVMLCV